MNLFFELNFLSILIFVLFFFISFLEINRKDKVKKNLFYISLLFTTISCLLNFRYLTNFNFVNNYNLIIYFSLFLTFFLYFFICIIDFSFIKMRFFFIAYFSFILISYNLLELNSYKSNNFFIAEDKFLSTHIILSFLSYSFLSISALSSIAIFLQEKNLKSSSTRVNFFFNSLPSIYESERITIKLLYATQVFLLLSLFSGFYYTTEITNNINDFFNEKSILSSLTFILICILLLIRYFFGVSGKKVFNIVLLSYFFINLSYFGIKLL